MVSEQPSVPRLGLSEAYHVANRWLTHAGAVPRAIEEPVDGVVELIGQGFHARIRIDAAPLTQGAVLALLRAVADTSRVRLMLFSATGYTTGALVFADTQGVALFDLTADGDVAARNTHARALEPPERLEPAFAGPAEPVTQPEAPETPPPESDPGTQRVEWKDCPRCGATHHPRANFCASCGADLHARLSVIAPEGGAGIPSPSKLESRGSSIHPALPGKPVPAPRPDAASLRCRTCGSHDIELIHPD